MNICVHFMDMSLVGNLYYCYNTMLYYSAIYLYSFGGRIVCNPLFAICNNFLIILFLLVRVKLGAVKTNNESG